MRAALQSYASYMVAALSIDGYAATISEIVADALAPVAHLDFEWSVPLVPDCLAAATVSGASF